MWHYAKDQEKHGPVSRDEVLGMLRAGSLADHDLVWRDGMGEWKPIAEVMELQRALFASRTVTPAGGPAPQMAASPSQNGLAITSMVLGIVSIMAGTMAFTGIPAVIFGHIARRQIRESAVAQGGDGMAIAGLILGYISIILTVGLILLFVGLFAAVS